MGSLCQPSTAPSTNSYLVHLRVYTCSLVAKAHARPDAAAQTRRCTRVGSALQSRSAPVAPGLALFWWHSRGPDHTRRPILVGSARGCRGRARMKSCRLGLGKKALRPAAWPHAKNGRGKAQIRTKRDREHAPIDSPIPHAKKARYSLCGLTGSRSVLPDTNIACRLGLDARRLHCRRPLMPHFFMRSLHCRFWTILFVPVC